MSGYRPPSTEPRGKWARAIHAKRRELGLSQTGGFEVLGERLGLGPKSRAAYVAIDLGLRQPTDAEAVVLADWLGGYPSDDMPTSAPPLTVGADVGAYLSRIDALVAQMAEDRKLIRQLLARLSPGAAPEDEEAVFDLETDELAGTRTPPRSLALAASEAGSPVAPRDRGARA